MKQSWGRRHTRFCTFPPQYYSASIGLMSIKGNITSHYVHLGILMHLFHKLIRSSTFFSIRGKACFAWQCLLLCTTSFLFLFPVAFLKRAKENPVCQVTLLFFSQVQNSKLLIEIRPASAKGTARCDFCDPLYQKFIKFLKGKSTTFDSFLEGFFEELGS